ncbi:putative serine/threonine protein kinase [Actinoplanes missouriensis 431]|uniref:non-specific serine/threonine protein kinase n=1 Tax=Actinoplanes missouriensis (strain ATCC 14538 / DSM 43046 / CBS 188.64 / JCM 3121 / NBRC 102363 / NCIMB 12654 / NRRL B-3342 / UNCC 431) TaxID=512565 RepID=I0HEN7_ACTM4|nr:serine/threonine-protein kinase [Actinoplanes missouriensis]BAL91474.1 putative serine/threonine protein kinase [Actinoplanes missouriensis 431]
MPQPGELLGGRYRLDDRIAAGGMGDVWRATDTVLDRPVAVKTLLAGYAGDESFRSRFHHEARAMAALRHAGVVPVYDFGDTGDGAYLVMARVDGQPLDRRIAERGALSPAETMSIVAQAARALAAAHDTGIVHRDVKPGNLIIEPDGTVVLVDFGVARSAQSVTLTGAREVVGTALYIAPEQVSKQATGPAADVYALGVVAYHCLAGHPPFLGDNPLAVALQHVTDEPPPLPAGVPAPVRDLIATALAKDPAARFPSAAAMADAADRAVAGTDLSATLAGGADTVRFSPGAAGTAGAAGIAGAAGTTGAAGIAGAAAASTSPAETAVTSTRAWTPPPGSIPPPDPTARTGPGKRRHLVLLSALLAALIGAGTLIAVADPFGFFPATAPATTEPAPQESASKPGGAAKENRNDAGEAATTSTKGQEKKRSAESPAARASRTTTAPAATATTQPETTAPETTATTTPAEDPATATTAPETTTNPTGDSGGNGNGNGNGNGGGNGNGNGNGNGDDEEDGSNAENEQETE